MCLSGMGFLDKQVVVCDYQAESDAAADRCVTSVPTAINVDWNLFSSAVVSNRVGKIGGDARPNVDTNEFYSFLLHSGGKVEKHCCSDV
jgi:hypothetical protein